MYHARSSVCHCTQQAKSTGPAAAYEAASAEEHYKALCYLILDNAFQQLRDRFDSSAPGTSRYLQLEGMLFGGPVDVPVVEQYQELDKTSQHTVSYVQEPIYIYHC
jgi:hypothetical protein